MGKAYENSEDNFSKGSNEFGLNFNYLSYGDKNCGLKKDGFSSKIVLKIKPLKLEYF